VKSNSSNGDLHFVWAEFTALFVSQTKQSLKEAEAKKITKLEAPKPVYDSSRVKVLF
jgi:hypothetical protein